MKVIYEVNSCQTQQLANMIFEDYYFRFTFLTNLVFQAERSVLCPSVKKSSSAHLNDDIDSSQAMAERLYISDSRPDQGSRNSLRGSIVQV